MPLPAFDRQWKDGASHVTSCEEAASHGEERIWQGRRGCWWRVLEWAGILGTGRCGVSPLEGVAPHEVGGGEGFPLEKINEKQQYVIEFSGCPPATLSLRLADRHLSGMDLAIRNQDNGVGGVFSRSRTNGLGNRLLGVMA